MSDDRTFERNARAWLELGPTEAPDRVVEDALFEIDTTPQERDLRIPWRLSTMNPLFRLAAAAVVGVLAVGATLFLLRPTIPGAGSKSTPSPSLASVSPTLGGRPDTTLEGWIVFEYAGKAPDGSTPAGVDYPNSIWLVHADGTGLHELAPGIPASGKNFPDISPDGTKVAYSAWDPPVQIWEIGIEGGDPQLLTTDCSGQPAECMEGAPAYSPDGGSLAFLTGNEQSTVLAIRNLTSGAVSILESTRTASSDVWLGKPSWSPDGTQLVYHDVHRDPTQDKVVDSSIFIVNADDSGRHELALPAETPYGDADWTPDGSRIVFGSYPIHEFGSGKAEVYSVRPDGTDLQQLTSLGVGSGAPSWTADGAHIFFWGFQTFYLMDPDGGNAMAINRAELSFDEGGYGFYGLLQPTP
jgi:TolB protein